MQDQGSKISTPLMDLPGRWVKDKLVNMPASEDKENGYSVELIDKASIRSSISQIQKATGLEFETVGLDDGGMVVYKKSDKQIA